VLFLKASEITCPLAGREAGQGCNPEISYSYWRMRMDKKYEIIIFWSSEDNAFAAEVPELPGCMADGKTYQEAISNAEKIIDEWIETATRLGRPIPQPKRPPCEYTAYALKLLSS
jgi:predicted RNase H-like HicB family nuclease